MSLSDFVQVLRDDLLFVFNCIIYYEHHCINKPSDLNSMFPVHYNVSFATLYAIVNIHGYSKYNQF